MLKDISSIKLQGANFSSVTELPILDSSGEKYTKVSLIYGRNGSGKSTIAKALRKVKGEEIVTVTTVDSLNKENQPITLSEKEQSSIFVFDEDFVTANVRIEENGLGSIVMLGEQADLTVQIEQATRELEKAEGMIKKKEETLSEYQNAENPKAPQFYINQIRTVLQGDNGWAGRDSRAKGLRQNSRVNDDTYKKFITLNPEESRDELIVAFDSTMKELEAAKNGLFKIDTVVPSVPDDYKHYSTALANELLKKKIEKPELSNREKYLLSLVTDEEPNELETRIEHLNDDETKFCPYCLQDLTVKYKKDLVAQIQKVLTDEVKQHQTQLKEKRGTELALELSPFSSLPSYQTCVDLMTRVNNVINANNTLIQRKIMDVYSPISTEELNEITEPIQLLSEALKKLEKERMTHNSKAVKTKPIIDKLKSINDRVAYYDVISISKQLDKQKIEMTKAKKEYDDAIANRDEKKEKLEDLNGRRKRIDIAIDLINNELKYIFFSEGRLSLEINDNLYKLFSNGHPVLPKNVSVGERNIIGLCYFFASIMTGKNRDTAYDDEYIIIIDDPVSSYDFENKVGILSFLKYKLGQFLNGNVNSRAVVMTHDLQTLFDLEKVCKELSKGWGKIFPGVALRYRIWELKNCFLKQFEYKNRQEYTELIKLIYEYGCGSAGEYDIVIGNIMRQALEAFSTFEYRKGIVEVSNDDSILVEMGDDYKTYFKNLMYRIVLNNGSHREEQALSMEVDFFSMISEAEKRRTAKEIICFIYRLNKMHLIAHLGNVSGTLDTWCSEIKSRAAVI